MIKIFRLIAALLILFLPSKLKILFYRIIGHSIGKGCYIGFSLILCNDIMLGDYVYIGHFNFFNNLNKLEAGSGSRINLLNWIAGGSTGCFSVGKNSSISIGHYFDASADIFLGNNSIIAGRGSHFFTHGITPTNLCDRRPISMGDWCYIGSSSRFLPGTGISNSSFVGMGSVVTKKIEEQYVLIAGSPAVIRKKIPKNVIFFNRKFLPHRHHPAEYKG